jgi:hypothetical protein
VAIDDPTIYVGDGEHVLHSWFGAELTTMRKVKRFRRMERDGWRGVLLLIGRRLFGQDAYHETYWDEEPDHKWHQILDGHYLCPRCDNKTLEFPFAREGIALFD